MVDALSFVAGAPHLTEMGNATLPQVFCRLGGLLFAGRGVLPLCRDCRLLADGESSVARVFTVKASSGSGLLLRIPASTSLDWSSAVGDSKLREDRQGGYNLSFSGPLGRPGASSIASGGLGDLHGLSGDGTTFFVRTDCGAVVDGLRGPFLQRS